MMPSKISSSTDDTNTNKTSSAATTIGGAGELALSSSSSPLPMGIQLISEKEVIDNIGHPTNLLHSNHHQVPSIFRFLVGVFTLQKTEWDFKRAKHRRFDFNDTVTIISTALVSYCASFTIVYIYGLSPTMSFSDPELVYSPALHSELLVGTSISYGFGKLFWGYIIDSIKDSRRVIQFISLTTPSMCILFSFVHSIETDVTNQRAKFTYLAVVAAINSFVASGTSAANSKFIYRRFKPAQQGTAMSFASLGGRFGSISTSLIISAAVRSFGTWQIACRIICAVAYLGFFFTSLTYFFPSQNHGEKVDPGHVEKLEKTEYDSHEAKAPPKAPPPVLSARARFRLYLTWFLDEQFLLMLFIVCSLRVISGFEGFLPLFLGSAFKLPRDVSTSLAVSLPAGYIASLLFGPAYLEKLTKPGKANATIYMTGAATLLLTALSIWTSTVSNDPKAPSTCDGGCVAGLGILIFFTGFCAGYPYFVPPGVYSLSYGENSGMVISLFDSSASAVYAIYAAIVSKLTTVGNFSGVVGILAGFGFLSFVFYIRFHYIALSRKKFAKVALAIAKDLKNDMIHAEQLTVETVGSLLKSKVVNPSEELAREVLKRLNSHEHHKRSEDSTSDHHYRGPRDTAIGRILHGPHQYPSRKLIIFIGVLVGLILCILFAFYLIVLIFPSADYNFGVIVFNSSSSSKNK